jgi:membrane dipeptidase
MAAKGGVIGIYFMPFLGDNGSPWATKAMVLDHLEHALKVCGEDHVGIGTDGPIPAVRESKEFFDMMQKVEKHRADTGIQAPGEAGRFPYIQELNQPRRIEEVAQGLQQRGYPERVIEKVIGGNFHRVFGEIWT